MRKYSKKLNYFKIELLFYKVKIIIFIQNFEISKNGKIYILLIRYE